MPEMHVGAPHPATLKAQLRAALSVDLVVTGAQLERWGLARAAVWLDLPRITRTCRTRVTQSESDTDLTFVALTDGDLNRSPRDLMHLAALAEARRSRVLEPGEVWRHVALRGRSQATQADAEIIQTRDPGRRSDWAVEFDAGYSPGRIAQKLEGAVAAGYTRVLWATSIHARTRTVRAQAVHLQRRGRLPDLVLIETRFVDFWSPHDPYGNRPRCHKPVGIIHRFQEGGG